MVMWSDHANFSRPARLTPSPGEKISERLRFFLEHDKTDWFLDDLQALPSPQRSEAAASLIDAIAESSPLRDHPDSLRRAVKWALALSPSRWEAHAPSWARSIVSFCDSTDIDLLAHAEHLVASAPSSLLLMPMEGSTVRSWIEHRTSGGPIDWAPIFDHLLAHKHHPQKALVASEVRPFDPSPALESLRSVLYHEMAVSDFDCGESMDILHRCSSEERPYLCLFIFPSVCDRILDNLNNSEEYLDMFELCAAEVLKTTSGMRLALGNDWCSSLSSLQAIGDDQARSIFDRMAAMTEPALLDSRYFDEKRSWKSIFQEDSGWMRDLLRSIDAAAESDLLRASATEGLTPLQAALSRSSAKSAPRRSI